MHKIPTETLVCTSIFIALTILFTDVFSIQTPFLRLSFGFLPIAIFAAIFGPLPAGIMAAAADILGTAIFFPGIFFPGFTLSSFLSGILYGLFLHHRQPGWPAIITPFLLIFFFIDLGLNTLWLIQLYHKAAEAFFLSRLIKCSICLPIQIGLFYLIYRPIAKYRAIHSKK